MKTLLSKLYTTFDRNNKKIHISSSGSIPSSTSEKIRSGQSYLYQKEGMESEVIEIRFYKNISGSSLNMALNKTIKRYPYLNTKLIELDGNFYIVKNEIGLVARKTPHLSRLGHVSCGYHLIDVTYDKKTIYVSFHHALCDGRGIKPFLETLLYYYCSIQYNSHANSQGIQLADSPLLEGETVEPSDRRYAYDENKQPVEVSRDAYAIPENVIEEHDTDYRYEIQIPVSDFMRVCKENNATPVILTSLLVSGGIAHLYPDFDKPINANVAVDIRAALDVPNTFKNCVRSMPLPFSREFLPLTLAEQSKQQRDLLQAHRDRDNCRRLANSSLEMYDKLDSLNGYEDKQKMMSFFDGMLMNTYVISYLGQIILNENAEYVDAMFLYNSGAAGLGVTIISCGETFCVTFKQSFASDKYLQAFCFGLDNLGIPYTVSGVIPFLTPKDSLIRRD